MQTLILLKPDCVQKGLCGTVITRFEKAGLAIRACKMMRLSEKILKEHYAHIADKPFFPEIQSFMQETPVIAMVLEGENAVSRVREMLGVTDCLQAAAGTIRAEYGSKETKTSKMKNIAHASDSEEASKKEIARFFRAEEIME